MRKHVTPGAGLKVRMPDGGVLPENGKTVEITTYWHRRKADGDVTWPEDKSEAKTASPAKQAEKSKGGE